MFFEAWWAVPYQRISEVRCPRLGGGICRGPTILLYKTYCWRQKILKKILSKIAEKALQLQFAVTVCDENCNKFFGGVINVTGPLRVMIDFHSASNLL